MAVNDRHAVTELCNPENNSGANLPWMAKVENPSGIVAPPSMGAPVYPLAVLPSAPLAANTALPGMLLPPVLQPSEFFYR